MRILSLLVLSLSLAFTGCTTPGKAGGVRNERKARNPIVDPPLKIVFFDLGQADGMLLVYKGKTLLMDAGEARVPEDQQRFHRIAATLEQLTGKKHLDYFVLSHYHRDHVGNSKEGTGLWGVLDDGVTIGTVYDRGSDIIGGGGKGDVQLDWEKAVPGWLKSGQVKEHKTAKRGDLIDLGEGLTVEVVAVNGNEQLTRILKTDPKELDIFPASENDYSVALKVTYGDFEFFTGGDLTGLTSHRDFKGHREGYHDVESSVAERVGDVELYRANHHGSRHSSNPCFIKVLRPEVSIISSGENDYGHPTEPVFDRLSEAGRVYITGGASDRVKRHVAPAIMGDDVVVDVEAGGKRFAVNGRDVRSKSEQQEQGLPNRVEKCEELRETRDE